MLGADTCTACMYNLLESLASALQSGHLVNTVWLFHHVKSAAFG